MSTDVALLTFSLGAPESGDWEDPVDAMTGEMAPVVKHQMWQGDKGKKRLEGDVDLDALTIEVLDAPAPHGKDKEAGPQLPPSPPVSNSRTCPSSPDVPLAKDPSAPVNSDVLDSPTTPRRSQPPDSETDDDGEPTPKPTTKLAPEPDFNPAEFSNDEYGEPEVDAEDSDHDRPPNKKRRLLVASSDVEGASPRKSSRSRKPPPPPRPATVATEASPSGSNQPKKKRGRKAGNAAPKTKAGGKKRT